MFTFTLELNTQIDIDAPPETVWSILTDLNSYVSWNPFIVEAGGHAVAGQQLSVRIQPVGGSATTFKPEVTVVEEPLVFEWFGRLGIPRLFDGRHRFELQPLDNGTRTRFKQDEHMAGLLVPLLAKRLNTGTLEGFRMMNEAIKQRAESRHKTGLGIGAETSKPRHRLVEPN